MSKAGQNNFSGISKQADITFYYLLVSYEVKTFEEIIIEGNRWEDFTLVFNEHIEDFEVKWHNMPITYSTIKGIIKKEKKKSLNKLDRFNIIVKKISKIFFKDFEYIKTRFNWIYKYNNKRDFWKLAGNNEVILKLLKKKWTKSEIEYIFKTNIVVIESDENLNSMISEYFDVKYPFYLNIEEQEKLISNSFRRILTEGSKGGKISSADFNDYMSEYTKCISEYSQSFSPEISLLDKIINLKPYLITEDMFEKLNNKKYLTPISINYRLISYISNILAQKSFHFDKISFFVKNILLKQQYFGKAFRIIDIKWKQGNISVETLFDILLKYYKYLKFDYIGHEVLNIILDIVKRTSGLYDELIVRFLKTEVLEKFDVNKKKSYETNTNNWEEENQVAQILVIFYERAKNKKLFVDFIFDYFDFTGDDFDNVLETHPSIYRFLTDFILENVDLNLMYIVKKITKQFDIIYNNHYQGRELSGSSISSNGSNYIITDRGITRFIFQPLFNEIYASNKTNAWVFLKKEILNKREGKDCPIYLKRALVKIVINRLLDESITNDEKKETFDYLKSILLIKKGFPRTSEVIFNIISNFDISDIKKIGMPEVMKLVEFDSIKYRRKDYKAGYPTNTFIIITLLKMIKDNYFPAKEFLFNLIEKPDFNRYDQSEYHLLELITKYNLIESLPDFIIDVLKKINLKNHIITTREGFIREKSDILRTLILHDWNNKTNHSKNIINNLMRGKSPHHNILEFVCGPIDKLISINPIETYKLYEKHFTTKELFNNKFKNNPQSRQRIVWMVKELIKCSNFDGAINIINLCFDDPNPETNNREDEFNYHLKIKNGQEETLITTVRGVVAYILRYFLITKDFNLIKYAFDKLLLLLDLDFQLANKLGFIEPDYYVRSMAICSLSEIYHPETLKLIDKNTKRMVQTLKELAFELLDIVQSEIEVTNIIPISIINNILKIFNHMRNLNTTETKKIVDFFEKYGDENSYFLFIHFALYHKSEDKDIDFEPKYFSDKLKQLCYVKNKFSKKFSWYFWCEARKGMNEFNFIEEYWLLLFSYYDHETYRNVYRTLEITLKWPDKYKEHLELLIIAIENETQFQKGQCQKVQNWGLNKSIFETIQNTSVDDFLIVFKVLLDSINDNIYYFCINDCIHLLKGLKLTTKKQKEINKNVEIRINELYPEEFH